MEWKSINDNYEISNVGDVRNKHTQRILKPWQMGRYLGTWLGSKNRQYIHRLVANAFLIPIEGKPMIDHIDRNRFNNSASNLRWADQSDNMNNKGVETNARKNNAGGEHHIYKDRYNNYRVQVVINKIKHCGYCYTLEDARKFRDDIINNNPK